VHAFDCVGEVEFEYLDVLAFLSDTSTCGHVIVGCVLRCEERDTFSDGAWAHEQLEESLDRPDSVAGLLFGFASYRCLGVVGVEQPSGASMSIPSLCPLR